MSNAQRYHVEYAPRGGYQVWEVKGRRVVFQSDSKSEAIAKSQELNGWPVDGDESSYDTQRRSA